MIVSGSVLIICALSFPQDQSLLGSSANCFEKRILWNGYVLAEFSQTAVLVSYDKKNMKF